MMNIGGKNYTKGEEIGKGNQGSVFKGWNQQEEEEVAIKQQETISNTEYEILQSLTQNPKANIIGIKGLERNVNGMNFIVMELADNELYKYMIENPELSKNQINQIFYQMVQAVKELHELGYFHRDLKPQNFVVFKKDANGFIKTKLVDFGLCKQQRNEQHTNDVGTPYYIAPEVFIESSQFDDSIDSWALGCIWYELMTGEIFFNGNRYQQILRKIESLTQSEIESKIQSQQIFNEQEKSLLKSLIQKDINQRILVKELAQRLQADQNNNQINSNFSNIQTSHILNTPNNINISQSSQFQNINQFQQPNNLNLNQENHNQYLNLQEKENYQTDSKLQKRLESQKKETEQQLKQYKDDDQRVSNIFIQQCNEKKSSAQFHNKNLLNMKYYQMKNKNYSINLKSKVIKLIKCQNYSNPIIASKFWIKQNNIPVKNK